MSKHSNPHGPARSDHSMQRSMDLFWTESAAADSTAPSEPLPPLDPAAPEVEYQAVVVETVVELIPVEKPEVPLTVELVEEEPKFKVELIEEGPKLKVELVESPQATASPAPTALDWLGDVQPEGTKLDWLADVEAAAGPTPTPPPAPPATAALDWLADVAQAEQGPGTPSSP
jgi:hypothetical protein